MSDQTVNGKIEINGKKNANPEALFKENRFNVDFEIESSYNLNVTRSDTKQFEENLEEGKILRLTTETGLEWYGYADDIAEIHSTSNADRGENVSFTIPTHISASQSRGAGLIETFKNEVLDIIKVKVSDMIARKLAEFVDSCIVTPELMKLDANLEPVPYTAPTGKILLLLHGTISRTGSAFKNIDNKQVETLFNRYGNRIYGYDHYTISKTPIENARDLLEQLPDEIHMDIVSHSRGGLVADVLARCNYEDRIGYTVEEISLLELAKSETSSLDEQQDIDMVIQAMRDINNIILRKKIVVNRIVRVACPAAGTILLGERADHFFNALLNGIGHYMGKGNTFYEATKYLLLHIISKRYSPSSMRGLWSMVPDSAYQKINNAHHQLSSELYNIAGDSNVGSWFNLSKLFYNIGVVLTNLFYREANDFVVHTASMKQGIVNRKMNKCHLINTRSVHHFNYFSNEGNMAQVLLGLSDMASATEDTMRYEAQSRGDIKKMLDVGLTKRVIEDNDKPVVVILPGVMGSHLYVNKDRKWLHLNRIIDGSMYTHLQNDAVGVEALSTHAHSYQELMSYLLRNGYEVTVMPYDWRHSTKTAAKELDDLLGELLDAGRLVSIVSHSMGGLVTRAWKNNYPANWQRFKEKENARWIMLGTPWRGSHMAMEIFTGISSRVSQLAFFDMLNSKRRLTEVVVEYPGLYELLPREDDSLLDESNWPSLDKQHSETWFQRRNNNLGYLAACKGIFGSDSLSEDELSTVYYIAGHSDKTIHSISVDYNWFKGKYLKKSYTAEGDGTVTWQSGIPLNLKADNLFYTEVSHGALCAEPKLFRGIYELLRFGATSQRRHFKKSPPISRSRSEAAAHNARLGSREVLSYNPRDAENVILGIDPIIERSKVSVPALSVCVYNSDLKWAQYPVMVGHFKNDGIVSAESAIDRYLDYKLSERHVMGFYPGRIGEQAVIFSEKDFPKGAIVVGLGSKDGLNGYQIARTVEKAMLNYALFFRDNHIELEDPDCATSISTLLVGSNYGRVPMKESIRSILLGIQNANKLILGMGGKLRPITQVEFVDYYKDNAYEAFKILQSIEVEDNSIHITLHPTLEEGFGVRSRFLRDESDSWWQTFTTKVEQYCDRKGEYLSFTTYNGLSSVPQDEVYSDLNSARHLAKQLSNSPHWNPRLSKTIFELLLPNQYKDFVRNHRNIEWRMDIQAAEFPWEMFHDRDFGDKPTFISSGLIRQLYTRDGEPRPALVTSKTALVIGDPVFASDSFIQLPGAEAEAREVNEMLENGGFHSTELIQSDSVEILQSLYSDKYKVLHIASHGVFNLEENRVGIAIGEDVLLTPGTIKQLTAIPEFVFINCCYGGQIDALAEELKQDRHKLAANVGTQLIAIGVKAVVVAGWAVDDTAARVFAEKLYDEMLSGVRFGEAVTTARYTCYESNKNVNTWGAYQCYGDPSYRLVSKRKGSAEESEYSLPTEILLELDNIINQTKSVDLYNKERNTIQKLFEQTDQLISQSKKRNINHTGIIEREAIIYTYLGDYEKALVCYENLFAQDDGQFHLVNLDTYYNIKAKALIARRDRMIVTSALSEASIISQLDKEMKEIVTEIEKDSKAISNGPRRLANIASTIKRGAILNTHNQRMQAYLKKASQYYWQSALAVGPDTNDGIYPSTSFINLAYVYNVGVKTKKIDIQAILGNTIMSYLEEALELVRNSASKRNDIWGQLRSMQLYNTLLLVNTKGSKYKDDDLADKLIDLYERQLRRSISIKDLIGEIEHIHFLHHVCFEFKTLAPKVKHYKRILNFLNEFRPRIA